MSTEQEQITTPATTKKHTRSRGRAKRAHDPYDSAYGNLPLEAFRIRPWTYAEELDRTTVGTNVIVLGEVKQVRRLRRTSAIVVLYDNARSVRCTVVAGEGVTKRMVGFAATLPQGTLMDVEGMVSLPGSGADILGTTQKVEVRVRKLHAIGTRKDGSSQSSSDISSTTMASELGKMEQATAVTTKKHTRSRGRAKRAQDPYDSAYGNLPWAAFNIRPWTCPEELDKTTVGKHVITFGVVRQVRRLSKTSAIVVLYDNARSVRCMVVANADEAVNTRMVGFAATLRRGTLIDVEGVVVSPSGTGEDLLATTQKVEVQVRRLHAIGTRKDGSSQGSSDISS